MEWCTKERLKEEWLRGQALAAAGGSGAGAGKGGGAGPGGSGAGAGPDGSGAGAGQAGQQPGPGLQGPPRGGSGGAQFANKTAGGAQNTTRSNHGGGSSYDIAQHMSQLSIGQAKPAGHSGGQPSSGNVLADIQHAGEGATDAAGHAVYFGDAPNPDPKKKGKFAIQRVSVNAYGTPVGGHLFFCSNSQGQLFNEPPKVSSQDPNPTRAAKLYAIATALYSGQRHAATLADYHALAQTHNDPQRPLTAGSGGSGDYTTRPGSRDGADYSAAAPRTTPYHTTTSYGQVAVANYGAPAVANYGHPAGGQSSYPVDHHYKATAQSRPSSSGSAGPGRPSVSQGGPSKPPAAQQPPSPPRTVKIKGSKAKETFTVHGIDKGKPYITLKERHYVSWSASANRFYIKKKKEMLFLETA